MSFKFSDEIEITESEVLKRTPENTSTEDMKELGKYLSCKHPEKISNKLLKHLHWLYWGQALMPNSVSYDTDVNLILNELNQRSNARVVKATIWLSILALIVSLLGLWLSYKANENAEKSGEIAEQYLEKFTINLDKSNLLLENFSQKIQARRKLK